MSGLNGLIHQGLGAVGGDLGDERRRPGDPNAFDEVLLRDVTAGSTLSAQGHGAACQDAPEQVTERGRVIKHHLIRAPRQCEPGGLTGEPEGHRHPAGERGGGHVQGLAAALGLVFARGDLDDESAYRHGRTLAGAARSGNVPGGRPLALELPWTLDAGCSMAGPSPATPGEGPCDGPTNRGRPLCRQAYRSIRIEHKSDILRRTGEAGPPGHSARSPRIVGDSPGEQPPRRAPPPATVDTPRHPRGVRCMQGLLSGGLLTAAFVAVAGFALIVLVRLSRISRPGGGKTRTGD